MTAPRSNLAVLVDGVALPEGDARALWERFSTWMEEHRGDLAGFAASEGFASIHPGVDRGRPVLLASKTETRQRPYAPATALGPTPRGGSADRQKTGACYQGGDTSKPRKGVKR
ncbi:MAG TPA: hypothetical protein VM925_08070 [Labilithrix sp.]|nr:hypothetical protein [Labilithrix sp.]